LVASRTKHRFDKQTIYRYDIRKVHAVSLTATPKQYLQFTRPGDSAIIAMVIDIEDTWKAERVTEWVRSPERVSLQVNEKTNVVSDIWGSSFVVSFVQRVSVPAELFAPPPPKFLRTLVTQFFPAYAVDQCHFRRRVLLSLPLFAGQQLYGLFARLSTLLFGLFMLQRGMQPKALFAINPHDFARSFEGSFWLEDKKGHDREGFLWKLTPPWLVVYVAFATFGAAMLSLLPMGYLALKYGDALNDSLTIGEFLLTVLAIDGAILVFVGAIVLTVSWKARRGVQRIFRKLFPRKRGMTPEEELKAKETAAELARRTLHEQLLRRASQGSQITSADDVPDNSIRLLFQRTKRAVCKPFAQK
jgi:hypothetical protein